MITLFQYAFLFVSISNGFLIPEDRLRRRHLDKYDPIMMMLSTCYKFGDCIDRCNVENEFFTNRLLNYMDDAIVEFDRPLRSIEIKLNSTGYIPPQQTTRNRYRLLIMCWPDDTDIIGDIGNRFARKMYKAYLLANQAKYTTYKLKIFTTNLLSRLIRLNSIIDQYYNLSSNNDTRFLIEKDCETVLQKNKTEKDEYTALCYRNGDCIDEENDINRLYLDRSICIFNDKSIEIRKLMDIIESKFKIKPEKVDGPPFNPMSECLIHDYEKIDEAYVNKVNNAYKLGYDTNNIFYLMTTLGRELITRFSKIYNVLIR